MYLLDFFDFSEGFFATAIEVDARGALRFLDLDLFRVGYVLVLRYFNGANLFINPDRI